MLKSLPWVTAGLFIALYAFFFLCQLQHHYFNQDDNFAQFTPVIVSAMRSLIYEHTFPEWNPYNSLGAPAAVAGIYALTYPPTYLAAWIADKIFHQPGLFPNLFFLIHLLPAMIVSFLYFKKCSHENSVALAASLSFVFSGFFLMAGRSWYYMIPTMLWLPTIMLLLIRPSFPSMLTGCVMGIYFHSGNAQMWVYTFIFVLFFLGFKIHHRTATLKQCLIFICTACACAAPLAVPQTLWMSHVLRHGGLEGHILRALPGMLLPYPLISAEHPMNWGFPDGKGGMIAYFGTFFALGGCTAVLYPLWNFFYRREPFPKNHLYAPHACALAAAYILGAGRYGAVMKALFLLPVFKQFSLPFKFIPFIAFFSIGLTCIALQHLRNQKGRFLCHALAASTLLLWIPHIQHSTRDFYHYYNVYPTHTIEQVFQKTPQPRILNSYPMRSMEKNYPLALPHNLQSLFQITGMYGIEPSLDNGTAQQAFLRTLQQKNLSENASIYGITHILNTSSHALPTPYPIENPTPPVFDTHALSALDYTADFSGIHITSQTSPQNITAAWIQRPFMVAYTDTHTLPITHDSHGRITLHNLPSQWKSIHILFKPPWLLGWLIAGLSFTTALFLQYPHILKRVFDLKKSTVSQ
jgi:hypothetical protein